MNKYFLIGLFFLVSTVFTGCSIVESPEQKQKTQELIKRAKNSKITLIDIHHNGCEPCKLIKPIFNILEAKYENNSDVSFLTYDLSNPFKASKSMKIAKELGLEKLYKSQRYTGVVLVIDSMTKEVVDTLVAEENEQKYINSIETNLKNYEK